MGLDPYRPTAWAATSVGLAEGLVEIVVNRVEPHAPGVGLPEDRVEVRSVVVHLPASVMHNLGRSCNVPLEYPEGAWVGNHHGRGVVADCGPQGVKVDPSVLAAWDLYDVIAAHRRGRGVRAMGGVGDYDLVPMGLSVGLVELLDAPNGGELALRARDWL